MPTKNIIICSDGTGNTFDDSVSNVTRLVRLLDLDSQPMQEVAYDQGLGTDARRLAAVEAYRRALAHPQALEILAGPRTARFNPIGIAARLAGLTAGYGLKDNVRQVYVALTKMHVREDDRIFLFGFSRGAFTVRALAGLVYRCGLPSHHASDPGSEWFDEAWALFQPMLPDEEAVARFRARPGLRDVRIHFLGIWDTVKSYGGFVPIMLPHLRHNPIVAHVRHAVALDERRSWFNVTTWGQLDLDKTGAATRLRAEDLPNFRAQTIEEVWFRGCHSDIGGGDVEECTARVTLRWMLAEAFACGLRLTADGEAMIGQVDPTPTIHESLKKGWWTTEVMPRKEIDNSGVYPTRHLTYGRTGVRTPAELLRDKQFSVHVSAGVAPSPQVRQVWTKTLDEAREQAARMSVLEV